MDQPYPVLLVLAFPLAGFVINGLIGQRLMKQHVQFISCSSMFLAFLSALWCIALLRGHDHLLLTCPTAWIESGSFRADFSFLVDPLSCIMMLVITGIGFLIHVYSIGYMAHEANYSRYFTLLNLFVFFMLTLVTANNLLLTFVGWEGVGLCSFQLISFWFERPTAADAGKKAFIISRVGDFGFLLALMLLFTTFGTLNVAGPGGLANQPLDALTQKTTWGLPFAFVACILLWWGATAKSAQALLHTWLPDAMEGPTPVSALIHAATMVTAGVYLIARMSFLFAATPEALTIVAIFGGLTALAAATIAMVQHDIKRVLAYSTISQIGYMFLACGVGAYTAAIFHLVTHAFFKALLFLCAGSVLHACRNVLDMRRMGGLRAKMPVTAWTFWIGCLAIAGCPLLAGFFSKDIILHETFGASPLRLSLWSIGILTALLTTFYMFRLGFKVFEGTPRDAELHAGAHESPKVMTTPLVLLALGSVVAGYLWTPTFLGNIKTFKTFLGPALGTHVGETHATETALLHTASELPLMIIVLLAAVLGGIIAVVFYIRTPGTGTRLASKLQFVHHCLNNNWYFDSLYNCFPVRFGRSISERVARSFEQGFIDGTVNGIGMAIRDFFAPLLSSIQTGYVRHYALLIIGAGLVMLWLLSRSGV